MDTEDGFLLTPTARQLPKLAIGYRQKIGYYQKACKRVQLIYNVLSMIAIFLNTRGTIVGIELRRPWNKIALGVISGLGILLQSFLKLYDFEKKIYFRKFAVSQYKQILNKIEASIHLKVVVDSPEYSNLANEINMIEDIILDFCPLVKL